MSATLHFDKAFLQCFWDLASLDTDARVAAAHSLVGRIAQQSKASSSAFTHHLRYTVKRLVRGLSSSRDGARQGFALALLEILRSFPEAELADVFSLMDEFLPTAGVSKKDERGTTFGILFGVLAVMRSGRVAELVLGDKSAGKGGSEAMELGEDVADAADSGPAGSDSDSDSDEEDESEEESSSDSGEEEGDDEGEDEGSSDEHEEQEGSGDAMSEEDEDEDDEGGSAPNGAAKKLPGPPPTVSIRRLQEYNGEQGVMRWLKKYGAKMLHFVRKKAYLASIVFELLLVVCEQIGDGHRDTTLLPLLQFHFKDRPFAELSPEEVYFVDALRTYFDLKSFPSIRADLNDKKRIYSEPNFALLEPKLEASWHTHPKVNPVWKAVMEQAHAQLSEESTDSAVVELLVRVVDAHVSSNSNPRIYLAMSLIQQVVQQHPTAASVFFTRSVVSFFRDTLQAAKKKLPKNPIQPMGRVTLDAMVAAAASAPSSSLAAILAIIRHHEGKVNFDVKTGTSTMRTLLGGLDPPSFDVYANQLLARLYETAQEAPKGKQDVNKKLHRRNHHGKIKAMGATFSWVLQYVFELCRQREVSAELLRHLLRHLMALSFFVPQGDMPADSVAAGKKSKKSKSRPDDADVDSSWVRDVGKQRRSAEQAPELVKSCRERFLSLLPQLSSRQDAPEGDSWAATAFADFQYLMETCADGGMALSDAALASELTNAESVLDEIAKCKKKAKGREKDAKKSKDKHALVEAGKLRGLLDTASILAVQIVWQIAGGDGTVAPMLEELEQCAQKMVSKTKGEDENPYLVLLDLLIAQLTSSVRSIRPLVNNAFRRMCDSLPAEAVDMLLDVVAPGASNATLEDDGGEMGVEESDEESDEESGDDDESDGDGDSDDDSSDDSGSDYDPGEGKDGVGSEEARAMFAMAMGGDGEMSDIDLDNTDPDPEELQRFDERLAEMFRQMKERKAAQSKQEEAEKNLKLRVADLLEIFLKRNGDADSPFIWRVVVPLFRYAVQSEKRKELHALHARLTKLFSIVCKVKARASAGREIPFDEIQEVQEFFFKQLMGKADLDRSAEKGAKKGAGGAGTKKGRQEAEGDDESDSEGESDEEADGKRASAGDEADSWRLSPEMKKLCMHGLSMTTRVLLYHGRQDRQAFFDLAAGLVRAFVFAKNFTNSNLVVLSTLFARFPGVCWTAQIPLDVLMLASHKKERVRSMSFVFLTQLLRQGCVAVSRKPLKDPEGKEIDQGDTLKAKYLQKSITKMSPKLIDSLMLGMARSPPSWSDQGQHETMCFQKATRVQNVLLCTRALLGAVSQMKMNGDDLVYPSRLRDAVNSLAQSDLGKRSNKIRVHCAAIMKSLAAIAPKPGSKRQTPSTPLPEKKAKRKRRQ